MVAAFHDMPPIHYNDQVRIADGGQPVRDHEAGPSRCKAGKSPLDLHFGIGIDVAGGFVQDQHGRVRQHHAGDGEKLLLAFGNASAVRRDPGVVAVFQPSDEPVGARLLCGRDDFFHRGGRFRIGDIVPYAFVEKPGGLRTMPNWACRLSRVSHDLRTNPSFGKRFQRRAYIPLSAARTKTPERLIPGR